MTKFGLQPLLSLFPTEHMVLIINVAFDFLYLQTTVLTVAILIRASCSASPKGTRPPNSYLKSTLCNVMELFGQLDQRNFILKFCSNPITMMIFVTKVTS